MDNLIESPRKGESLRADWASRVASRLNSFALDGSQDSPLKRRLPKEKAPPKGRYAPTVSAEEKENEGDADTFKVEFENPYYRVGGRTYEGPSTMTEVEADQIVALKISATIGAQSPSLVKYESIEKLIEAEADTDYFIMPLIQLGASGNIVCDFRIGPDAAMGEFAS